MTSAAAAHIDNALRFMAAVKCSIHTGVRSVVSQFGALLHLS